MKVGAQFSCTIEYAGDISLLAEYYLRDFQPHLHVTADFTVADGAYVGQVCRLTPHPAALWLDASGVLHCALSAGQFYKPGTRLAPREKWWCTFAFATDPPTGTLCYWQRD